MVVMRSICQYFIWSEAKLAFIVGIKNPKECLPPYQDADKALELESG
jgi:hypothetical protein